MGKLGRFACIFIPMGLTIASLVCIILTFSGQLNKSSDLQSSLYFFKADTSNFTATPKNVKNLPEGASNLVEAINHAASSSDLKDFYQVGLWNYCEGTVDNKGKEKIERCSGRKSSYWFNPIDVWNLNGTNIQEMFPDKLKDGLNAYSKVAKWMFTAWSIAFFATLAEIVVGIFAIFSRWGSFVTTIVSSVSSVFTIAAAITSTALYGTLVGAFNGVLKPYNINASMGNKMLSVNWLAVAFSLGAGLFWLVSTCCCSGKSSQKKVVAEKTPYTYERVASPYLGAQGNDVHMNQMNNGHGQSGSAYEPFRHQGSHNV